MHSEEFLELKRPTCELSSRGINSKYYLSRLFIFFLADTLTMINSFNKKGRMSSDRKVGSYDRQKKNEAEQHVDMSSLFGFTVMYIQFSKCWALA